MQNEGKQVKYLNLLKFIPCATQTWLKELIVRGVGTVFYTTLQIDEAHAKQQAFV